MASSLAGCAVDPAGDPGSDPASQDDDDLGESVCTTGPYRCSATIRSRPAGYTALAPTPTGLGAPDLQSAYNVDPNVIVGTKPPVVAIVVAFGYLALESDLAVYRSHYGLPPCTIANGCLRVVNQNGLTSPLPAEPPPNDDWRVEAALDLDMASAACPKCNLLAVLANDNVSEGLFVAQASAVRLGATVISNSWGGSEDPQAPPADIAQLESAFNHPGVAIFAASGDRGFNDSGNGPGYPATSANVIAVGGTRLARASNARGWTEVAWTSGGSACSTWVAKPAYQTASPCRLKATSDVAAVGDPQTGVAVYNAVRGGWLTLGGTSASSPFVAALMAATGNGAQTSGAFFASNTAKLYDVTSGSNGTCAPDTLLCNAAVGWDGPTGYGTPNGKALLPAGATPQPGSDGQEPDDDEDVSGGCATTGSSAGLLLGVALLGLRRRRRAGQVRSAAPNS